MSKVAIGDLGTMRALRGRSKHMEGAEVRVVRLRDDGTISVKPTDGSTLGYVLELRQFVPKS